MESIVSYKMHKYTPLEYKCALQQQQRTRCKTLSERVRCAQKERKESNRKDKAVNVSVRGKTWQRGKRVKVNLELRSKGAVGLLLCSVFVSCERVFVESNWHTQFRFVEKIRAPETIFN